MIDMLSIALAGTLMIEQGAGCHEPPSVRCRQEELNFSTSTLEKKGGVHETQIIAATFECPGRDCPAAPLSKLDHEQAKAAREAARAKWAGMAPEEKAATKQAAKAKKPSEVTALDALAKESNLHGAEEAAAKTAIRHDHHSVTGQ